jgi:hypothetical protein
MWLYLIRKPPLPGTLHLASKKDMAARKEWTEWHLTTAGWQRGAMRVQGQGNTWVDDPPDRIVSFVYQEVETSAAPGPRISCEETWRSKTATNMDELLQQYGACPHSL